MLPFLSLGFRSRPVRGSFPHKGRPYDAIRMRRSRGCRGRRTTRFHRPIACPQGPVEGGPAHGQSVRRHPRREDEADRSHAQRPSAQVPGLAHAPRGVHGAPAPPPPCRGLTPHRSLKWRSLRLKPAMLYTGLAENCHTTNQSQESTCLTLLRNECRVGYWKAGGISSNPVIHTRPHDRKGPRVLRRGGPCPDLEPEVTRSRASRTSCGARGGPSRCRACRRIRRRPA